MLHKINKTPVFVHYNTHFKTKLMTAIDWLIDQMFKQGYFDGNKPLSITNLDHLQHQAKEIEKQQIIDAFDEGQEYEYQYHINGAPKFDSETYYNETYKGGEQ